MELEKGELLWNKKTKEFFHITQKCVDEETGKIIYVWEDITHTTRGHIEDADLQNSDWYKKTKCRVDPDKKPKFVIQEVNENMIEGLKKAEKQIEEKYSDKNTKKR